MERFSRLVFLLFVFLLPLQTVYLLREPMIGGEKWQYGTIGVYVTDILIVFIVGLYGWELFVRRTFWRHRWGRWQKGNIEKQKQSFSLLFARKQRASEKAVFVFRWLGRFLRSSHSSAIVFLVMFVGWAGVSILWAPDRVLTGYFLVKLLLASGVFVMARSLNDVQAHWTIRILFVGVILESVLGIGQFLLQSSFVSSWLGMSGHEAWQAGTSVLKNETGRWLRAYGTFPHPNMLGGYVGAVLMMVVGSGLWHSEKSRLWWLGGSLVMLLGLLLTFSRAAWLGVALGGLWFLNSCVRWFHFQQQPSVRQDGSADTRISGVWTIGMFVLAMLVFMGVLYETVFPRFSGSVINEEHSVAERVQSLWDARDVLESGNMWLGTGAGNMTTAMQVLEPERPIWSVQPTHNVWVLVWAELGLAGVMLFTAFLASVVWQVLRGRTRLVWVGVCLSLLPSLLVDHWLWSSHFGLIFLFLILGLSNRPSPGTPEKRGKSAHS